MNERNQAGEAKEVLVYGCLVFAILIFLCLQIGVITFPEPEPTPEPIIEVIENITVTEEPTPTPEPTEAYVDPFTPGPRLINQWYKWYRPDVQGLKDMQIGIVAYRYKILDRYVWWNPSMGNYFTQRASPGYKYFAVWVHEEMIGTNQTHDPSFWAFDDNAFALQVKDKLYYSQANLSYNPVVRIKEFDELTDYYNVITAPPFGYYVRYTGYNPEAGGYRAQKLDVLRMGKGNAHDGFILFEIPKDSELTDIQFLGNFGSFGDAGWKFY
jgi:hypothetical protein